MATYWRPGALVPVLLEVAVPVLQTLVQTLFPRTAGPLLAGLMVLLGLPAAQAEQVLCHYTYGGETRVLAALPVASPYAVKAIDVGSFFHFRVVFQNRPAALASIKIYAYADRDDGPLLIHQATYPYPPAIHPGPSYGFSGLHSVHEPVRDGELQYWCELTPPKRAGRRAER